MTDRNFTLTLGIIFVALGVAGFIPGLVWMPENPSPTLLFEPHYFPGDQEFGALFGLFPVNTLHNIAHLLVGGLGIFASADKSRARLYNRGFAISYLALALLGLFPYTGTLFGFMPIYGHNIWFNALTAVGAAYFGFVKPTQEAAARSENMASQS
ncbi:DUF4383 domain-containing protein [Laspinema palackyanum]|uniref:DUF4383 domain-containing protein n=1 Tax=Laspinema palackyanum TaxID=3231601 RepID=UPI00345D80F4|nr:DUF4383 domain-containing protein [Laspinema sp. D2c]